MKALTERLRHALNLAGLECQDTLFGSASDKMWGFQVEFERFVLLVGLWPWSSKPSEGWQLQIQLGDPGWLNATREVRITELKTVERNIHEWLRHELRARDIVWFTGRGSLKKQLGSPTP